MIPIDEQHHLRRREARNGDQTIAAMVRVSQERQRHPAEIHSRNRMHRTVATILIAGTDLPKPDTNSAIVRSRSWGRAKTPARRAARRPTSDFRCVARAASQAAAAQKTEIEQQTPERREPEAERIQRGNARPARRSSRDEVVLRTRTHRHDQEDHGGPVHREHRLKTCGPTKSFCGYILDADD